MSESTPLVLVVDDNEMNRDMLARRLQRQNCEVMMAENGMIALDMVDQHPFDLILLDIMMPQLSGYDVLERLKNDPKTRSIPVIMISAVDDLDSVVKCIELGAEDYLFKPFNPVLLKARVGATLNKRQLERSLQATQHVAELATELNRLRVEVNDLLGMALSSEQQSHVQQMQQRLEKVMSLLS